MKRILIYLLASILLISIMVVVAIYVPNTLPVGSDFSAIYYADLALVNGVHVYDIPSMEALARSTINPPNDRFFMPRFPYPPWYVISTFYLGLMSIRSAGALWFEINLVMLFLSVWFLTDGWNGRLRLIAFPLSLFFLPVLGALSVGQYGFPVLLGTSLLTYSLRKENVALTTLGAAMLTFKPHIGALILLSVLGWLIVSRSEPALSLTEGFGRSAMRSIVVAGVGLSIISLIADPLWFINYPKMLLGYQGEGNVSSCSECSSIPVWTSRWLFDGSLKQAAIIAIILFIILMVLFWLIRGSLLRSPELLVTSSLLVTLLVSPYLYNYDFILLLVPFAVLANSSGIIPKIIVILDYLFPTIAIILYSRNGNITLNIVTIIIAAFLYLRARSQVDFPAPASYNGNN
ncbi:MAG TPA: glycosyltransferase family 87 protein [Anaerolineales bacterium]|nr:glycosyltransferase family 87 protein [Anaerolineales bacterium]